MVVRPFRSPEELEGVVRYFVEASPDHLRGMGVEPSKIPDRTWWRTWLAAEDVKPDREKFACFLAWEVEGALVGHSSLSKIRFGEEAYVHLHLWNAALRRTGLGTDLFRQSVNEFFRRFALTRILCEPYAENAAPNRTLVKLGFRLVERRRMVPGPIHFEQDVNLYERTQPLPDPAEVTVQF